MSNADEKRKGKYIRGEFSDVKKILRRDCLRGNI
jgi:hypothetical protein